PMPAALDSMFASPEPFAPAVPAPALVSSRALLGASFELLPRTGADLRRASFYVGGIVLGTAGPAALAIWALDVVGFDLFDPDLLAHGDGAETTVLPDRRGAVH